MGFWGKLFKRADDRNSGRSKSGADLRTADSYRAERQSDTFQREEVEGEEGLRERLESVVAEEWPGYELRKNVPSSEMGAQKEAKKYYSYGIYHNGIPVAMIMLIENNNGYRLKGVRLAREACGERRVPYMNFMTYMSNHREYISERLRKNIKG